MKLDVNFIFLSSFLEKYSIYHDHKYLTLVHQKMIIFDKYDNDLLFEDLEMLENMIDLSYGK